MPTKPATEKRDAILVKSKPERLDDKTLQETFVIRASASNTENNKNK